jgi:hypothetical protein
MNLDLTLLTTVAVLVHLGVGIASAFLKDSTDQKKLAAIEAKTDQLVSTIAALAPAVPVAVPKNINQVAADLAAAASALAAATAPAPTPGGTS